jgi:hypothetical protein
VRSLKFLKLGSKLSSFGRRGRQKALTFGLEGLEHREGYFRFSNAWKAAGYWQHPGQTEQELVSFFVADVVRVCLL